MHNQKIEDSDYLSHWPKRIRKFRHKQWHYWSLNTPHFFIGQAQIQLGYLAKMFFYYYDFSSKKLYEWGDFSLGGKKLNIENNLTHWKSNDKIIKIENNHSISFNINDKASSLSGEIYLDEKPNDFKLLHNLGSANSGQLAYTCKKSTMQTSGKIQFNNSSFTLDPHTSFSATDWTSSWAKRKTRWRWASFSGLDQSKQNKIGLNLSCDVYVNQNGDGLENVLWINDKLIVLDKADIKVPKNPTKEIWRINASNITKNDNNPNIMVELDFFPLGYRKEKTNAIILKGIFIQPFGYFNGKIIYNDQIYLLQNIFGVVEEHFALW